MSLNKKRREKIKKFGGNNGELESWSRSNDTVSYSYIINESIKNKILCICKFNSPSSNIDKNTKENKKIHNLYVESNI